MAKRFAEQYAKQKTELKESGAERMRAIAGLNHPVFRDKPVNQDPREAFIHELFRGRGEYNLFHEYYHELARALFEAGVTRNVFCVNIDGVIGALLSRCCGRATAAASPSTISRSPRSPFSCTAG